MSHLRGAYLLFMFKGFNLFPSHFPADFAFQDSDLRIGRMVKKSSTSIILHSSKWQCAKNKLNLKVKIVGC